MENTKKQTIVKSFEEMKNILDQSITADKEEIHIPTPAEKRLAFQEYRNCTYNIVSLVAYLIGVPNDYFGEEDGYFLQNTYDQCEANKEARIIRNLCTLRTAIEKYYIKISRAFKQDLKNIGTLPEYIPTEAVNRLFEDGITIYKSNPDVDDYLFALNMEIDNRINNVAKSFPEWVKWEYIKKIFHMPKGGKKEGIKKAGELFNQDRNRFPYQCWLNWDAISSSKDTKYGNILHSDEKFITLLYERNEDLFENLSLVRDVGNQTMRNLTELLNRCSRCLIVVDCENSDAVKLAAALSSLPSEQTDKISKVLLFDSEYTTDQWKTFVDKTLRQAVNGQKVLPLEHVMVPRLNQSKSQVDMTLAVRTSKEVYINHVDAVMLVSSDSDYWAMIQQLDSARFLVMLERQKTGHAITDTLSQHEIPFCFIDDFCTHATYSIKTNTLINGIQSQIDAILSGEARGELNVAQMMENTLKNSWISMTEKEKDAFYRRYLLHMRMAVAENGRVSIAIGQ